MKTRAEDAFDTIESAHDFVILLAESVAEAKRALELDLEQESTSGVPRRLDTLRIAQYSMEKLETHVNRTSRILNDLRTLRRLLFAERNTRVATNKDQPGSRNVAAQLCSTSPDSMSQVAVA